VLLFKVFFWGGGEALSFLSFGTSYFGGRRRVSLLFSDESKKEEGVCTLATRRWRWCKIRKGFQNMEKSAAAFCQISTQLARRSGN